MSLFALGDTHLSFALNKPMDIFGEQWKDHHTKIKENWVENIQEEDTILLVGDISWGMNLEEAEEDLYWIQGLPGRKILIRGNHDYWWTSVSKLNKKFNNMDFLQNNYFVYEDYAVCGTRGWLCPNKVKFDQNDKKIYEREGHRLKLSLEAAKSNGLEKIICITHFPPTNDEFQDSIFTQIFEEYKVETVIYGHLHGKEDFKMGLQGMYNGVEYHLASCDYLNFNPKKIK